MKHHNADIRVREMGYTVEEFAAVLPAAMRNWTVGGGPHRWRVEQHSGSPVVRIEIEPQAVRQIGVLRLPVLRVSIDLSATPVALAAEFMRRFDRGFHRGGG